MVVSAVTSNPNQSTSPDGSVAPEMVSPMDAELAIESESFGSVSVPVAVGARSTCGANCRPRTAAMPCSARATVAARARGDLAAGRGSCASAGAGSAARRPAPRARRRAAPRSDRCVMRGRFMDGSLRRVTQALDGRLWTCCSARSCCSAHIEVAISGW